MIEIAEEVASAQFRDLLDRAAHGEVIVITRDGQPIVRLQAVTSAHDPDRALEAIRQLRDFARQNPVPGITRQEIKSWIEEGRP